MQWIAPSEKDAATDTFEKRLWEAADQLHANSGLTSAQYSTPVLGLIFLRFADVRFAARRAALEKQAAGSRRGTRTDEPAAYHAEGVLYLTPNARYDSFLSFPEGGKAGESVGAAVSEAMRDIEKHNPQLAGALPKTYEIFDSKLLKELLKKISEIPASIDYDAFGRIYEYFLGEFARTEGQKAASSTRRAASFASWSKCWNLSTVAFSIPHAVPAACSSRAPASSASTRKTPRQNLPCTVRKRSKPPSTSAA